MPEYIGGDDDETGAEYVGDGDDVLGAVNRGRAIQARRPAPAIRGGAPQKLRTFVGLGVTTWLATEADQRDLIIEPQRDFQPTGMVVDSVSSDGLVLVLVDEVLIGDTPQSPTVEQSAPASMFAHDSWGAAMLDFQNCTPGQKITLRLSPSAAPAAAQTATASAGMFGRALRGR
jgi:hypothetical protein